jgi:hypothetical protein
MSIFAAGSVMDRKVKYRIAFLHVARYNENEYNLKFIRRNAL